MECGHFLFFFFKSMIFFFLYLFVCLATPGLSCGTQAPSLSIQDLVP